jgi:hypothetical protein
MNNHLDFLESPSDYVSNACFHVFTTTRVRGRKTRSVPKDPATNGSEFDPLVMFISVHELPPRHLRVVQQRPTNALCVGLHS